jgi:hypothetical protein
LGISNRTPGSYTKRTVAAIDVSKTVAEPSSIPESIEGSMTLHDDVMVSRESDSTDSGPSAEMEGLKLPAHRGITVKERPNMRTGWPDEKKNSKSRAKGKKEPQMKQEPSTKTDVKGKGKATGTEDNSDDEPERSHDHSTISDSSPIASNIFEAPVPPSQRDNNFPHGHILRDRERSRELVLNGLNAIRQAIDRQWPNAIPPAIEELEQIASISIIFSAIRMPGDTMDQNSFAIAYLAAVVEEYGRRVYSPLQMGLYGEDRSPIVWHINGRVPGPPAHTIWINYREILSTPMENIVGTLPRSQSLSESFTTCTTENPANPRIIKPANKGDPKNQCDESMHFTVRVMLGSKSWECKALNDYEIKRNEQNHYVWKQKFATEKTEIEEELILPFEAGLLGKWTGVKPSSAGELNFTNNHVDEIGEMIYFLRTQLLEARMVGEYDSDEARQRALIVCLAENPFRAGDTSIPSH